MSDLPVRAEVVAPAKFPPTHQTRYYMLYACVTPSFPHDEPLFVVPSAQVDDMRREFERISEELLSGSPHVEATFMAIQCDCHSEIFRLGPEVLKAPETLCPTCRRVWLRVVDTSEQEGNKA